MDILALLEKLDAYISECGRVPLIGRVLVDEDEVFAIIDDIRAQLPQEMEQAKWVMKERERILSEARREGEDMKEDAQGQIATLASESAIAKEARAQAEELLARAREVATEINLGAREYADDLLQEVEHAIDDALARVRQGRKELSVPSGEVAAAPQDELGVESDDDAGFFPDDEEDEIEAPKRKKRR